ncbi:hypothetical protein HYFRA_00003574 [Hymenoscyphus fraxineus]|uniref:Uncharacterized protein n=1 Tax=Hymenoscyphus fraxineus TaxID=746836 RepID=A0A9N9PSG1_9HELO|nr:hypothetical protein HYFRA_00003574 [Hymenoscyphus fraxineus]
MGSGSSAWWDNVFGSVWEWITEEPFELRLSLIEIILRQEQKSRRAAQVLIGLFKLTDSNARMEDLQRSAGGLTLAAIAAPDMETFKSLNERRREFAELQGILLDKEDAEAEDACFEEVTSGLQFSLPELPSKQYERLKSNGRILHEKLNTIFKTLIGTITLMDSRANQESAKQAKIQAEKATMLTLLAAFYLPLTLCTGIFGMNIDKIVGSPGPGWLWVVVVLVALLIPSAGFIAYLFRRDKWWFWRSWGVFKSKKRHSDKRDEEKGQLL